MIILAGFEKFSNYKINLSERIVKNFGNQLIGHQIRKLILPVSWKRSILCYKTFISHFGMNPDLIILLGIHSGSKIRIERFSWNLSFGLDEDKKFRLRPISILPKLRISTIFDINSIKSSNSDKFKSVFSSFMGLYLCNHVYYNALLISANKYPVIFIHIPHHAPLGEIIITIKRIIYSIVESLENKKFMSL